MAVDVKVKVSGQQVRIVVYINGFAIKVADTFAFPNAENKKGNPLIDITKTVAVACGAGTAFFDYVYAMDITEDKYNTNDEKALNVYQGQFSNDTISFLYGDLLYNQNLDGDSITPKGKSIEERLERLKSSLIIGQELQLDFLQQTISMLKFLDLN
jgi:hypothetical protein